jgi:hypothetical protein
MGGMTSTATGPIVARRGKSYLLATFTHTVFFHDFGAYAPSVYAESVSVNAQPVETPGARSLPTMDQSSYVPGVQV